MDNNILLHYNDKSYRRAVSAFALIFIVSAILIFLLLSFITIPAEIYAVSFLGGFVCLMSLYAIINAFKFHRKNSGFIKGMLCGDYQIDGVDVSDAGGILGENNVSVATNKLCLNITKSGIPVLQFLVCPEHISKIIKTIYRAAPYAKFSITYKNTNPKIEDETGDFYNTVPGGAV